MHNNNQVGRNFFASGPAVPGSTSKQKKGGQHEEVSCEYHGLC